jgi:hypothetical protein
MGSTVTSLRPEFMAELDAAAERTAAVMASGASPAARQAAAEHEMETVERWLAASPRADAQLQHKAEMNPAAQAELEAGA